jgi:hypothetical protein
MGGVVKMAKLWEPDLGTLPRFEGQKAKRVIRENQDNGKTKNKKKEVK